VPFVKEDPAEEKAIIKADNNKKALENELLRKKALLEE